MKAYDRAPEQHSLCGASSGDAALVNEISRLRAEIERMQADAARQNKLMYLAANDIVMFGGFTYNPDDREFRVPPPAVLCSDFFSMAADCEEVPAQEIDALYDSYVRFGYAGAMAWVSVKRGGMNPDRYKVQEERDRELLQQFYAAREALEQR